MNKHYVVLVEVLAFPLLKSASLVTFLYGGSRLRLNICSASHFIFLLLDNALSETDWPSRAVRSVKSFLGPVYMEAGDPR